MNPFDRMYEGSPPWEIGRPQAAIAELARAGKIKGRVLDLGCGTGENALLLASLGLDVVGVDAARAAVAAAERKARAQGVTVHFLVHDALSVSALGSRFDTVLDSGFFHTLSDEARDVYKEEIKNVLAPGGSLFILCFSDLEPNWGGPRRVTEAELRSTFERPFFVESLVRARYENHASEGGGAHAWLVSVTYVGTPRGLVS